MKHLPVFLLFIICTTVQSNVPLIEVKASRIKHDKDSSATTLTLDEINQFPASSLQSSISTLPGVETKSSEFTTRNSSLFLRGNPSGYALVLYDGIEMNDPLDPGNNRYDFSFLTNTGIEKVEILHGPRTVKYGSNGIGGVIDIETVNMNSKLGSNGLVSYGSYNSLFATVSNFSKLSSRWKNQLGVDYGSSDGYSSYRGGLADGHSQYSLNSTTLGMLTSNTKLKLTTKYIANETELDDWNKDDQNSRSVNRQLFVGSKITNYLIDGDLINHFQLTYSTNSRKYIDEPDNSSEKLASNYFRSKKIRGNVHSKLKLSQTISLESGLGYTVESGETDSYTFTNSSLKNRHLYTTIDKTINKTTLSAGARLNKNSHKNSTSYPVEAELSQKIYNDRSDISLRYGLGYKPPSIIQLYSKRENNSLKQERSENFTLNFNLNRVFNISLYQTITDDMISYNMVQKKYFNLGKNRTRGIELSHQTQTYKKTSATVNYTYQECIDLNSSTPLPLRPNGNLKATVNHRLNSKISLWSSFTHNSSQHRNDYARSSIRNYQKYNLGINYKEKKSEYFLSLYNITNRKIYAYQTMEVAGITAISGVRVSL